MVEKSKAEQVYEALSNDPNYKGTLPDKETFLKSVTREDVASQIYDALSADNNYKGVLPDRDIFINSLKKKDDYFMWWEMPSEPSKAIYLDEIEPFAEKVEDAKKNEAETVSDKEDTINDQETEAENTEEKPADDTGEKPVTDAKLGPVERNLTDDVVEGDQERNILLINEVLNKNKDKNFVQRIYDPDNREKSLPLWTGKSASHLMEYGEWDGKYHVYPTVIEGKDGKLKRLTSDEAVKYAQKTGESIEFDSKKDAEWFSKHYKDIWDKPDTPKKQDDTNEIKKQINQLELRKRQMQALPRDRARNHKQIEEIELQIEKLENKIYPDIGPPVMSYIDEVVQGSKFQFLIDPEKRDEAVKIVHEKFPEIRMKYIGRIFDQYKQENARNTYLERGKYFVNSDYEPDTDEYNAEMENKAKWWNYQNAFTREEREIADNVRTVRRLSKLDPFTITPEEHLLFTEAKENLERLGHDPYLPYKEGYRIVNKDDPEQAEYDNSVNKNIDYLQKSGTQLDKLRKLQRENYIIYEGFESELKRLKDLMANRHRYPVDKIGEVLGKDGHYYPNLKTQRDLQIYIQNIEKEQRQAKAWLEAIGRTIQLNEKPGAEDKTFGEKAKTIAKGFLSTVTDEKIADDLLGSDIVERNSALLQLSSMEPEAVPLTEEQSEALEATAWDRFRSGFGGVTGIVLEFFLLDKLGAAAGIPKLIKNVSTYKKLGRLAKPLSNVIKYTWEDVKFMAIGGEVGTGATFAGSMEALNKLPWAKKVQKFIPMLLANMAKADVSMTFASNTSHLFEAMVNSVGNNTEFSYEVEKLFGASLKDFGTKVKDELALNWMFGAKNIAQIYKASKLGPQRLYGKIMQFHAMKAELERMKADPEVIGMIDKTIKAYEDVFVKVGGGRAEDMNKKKERFIEKYAKKYGDDMMAESLKELVEDPLKFWENEVKWINKQIIDNLGKKEQLGVKKNRNRDLEDALWMVKYYKTKEGQAKETPGEKETPTEKETVKSDEDQGAVRQEEGEKNLKNAKPGERYKDDTGNIWEVEKSYIVLLDNDGNHTGTVYKIGTPEARNVAAEWRGRKVETTGEKRPISTEEVVKNTLEKHKDLSQVNQDFISDVIKKNNITEEEAGNIIQNALKIAKSDLQKDDVSLKDVETSFLAEAVAYSKDFQINKHSVDLAFKGEKQPYLERKKSLNIELSEKEQEIELTLNQLAELTQSKFKDKNKLAQQVANNLIEGDYNPERIVQGLKTLVEAYESKNITEFQKKVKEAMFGPEEVVNIEEKTKPKSFDEFKKKFITSNFKRDVSETIENNLLKKVNEIENDLLALHKKYGIDPEEASRSDNEYLKALRKAYSGVAGSLVRYTNFKYGLEMGHKNADSKKVKEALAYHKQQLKEYEDLIKLGEQEYVKQFTNEVDQLKENSRPYEERIDKEYHYKPTRDHKVNPERIGEARFNDIEEKAQDIESQQKIALDKINQRIKEAENKEGNEKEVADLTKQKNTIEEYYKAESDKIDKAMQRYAITRVKRAKLFGKAEEIAYQMLSDFVNAKDRATEKTTVKDIIDELLDREKAIHGYEYQSKDKRYKTTIKDNEIIVIDNRTGNPLNKSSKNYQKIIDEYLEDIAKKWEKYPEIFEDQGEMFTNDLDYYRYLSRESKDPVQIAIAYLTNKLGEVDLSGSKDEIIASNLGRLPISDIKRWWDENALKGDINFSKTVKLNYFAKQDMKGGVAKHIPMDVQAETLSKLAGFEITVNDIIDFIERHPNGTRTYKSTETFMADELADRFYELTGIELTQDRAKTLIGKEVDQINKTGISEELVELIERQGITLENFKEHEVFFEPHEIEIIKNFLKNEQKGKGDTKTGSSKEESPKDNNKEQPPEEPGKEQKENLDEYTHEGLLDIVEKAGIPINDRWRQHVNRLLRAFVMAPEKHFEAHNTPQEFRALIKDYALMLDRKLENLHYSEKVPGGKKSAPKEGELNLDVPISRLQEMESNLNTKIESIDSKLKSKRAEWRAKKRMLIDETQSQGDLFGSKEKEKQEGLFDVPKDLSKENIEAILAKLEGEMMHLQKERLKLEKDRDKVKEALEKQTKIETEDSGQETLFDKTPKKGRKKTGKKKKTEEEEEKEVKETGLSKPEDEAKGKPPGMEEKEAERVKDWVLEDPTDNSNLKGIGFVELIELYNKITKQWPLVKKLKKFTRGQFHPTNKRIYLDRLLALPINAAEKAKVLAHEIGHLIDYLGQVETMDRGNVLGRIGVLGKYLQKTLPEKPEGPNNILTPEDRARLKKEAKTKLQEEYNKGIREIIEEVIREEPIFDQAGITADDVAAIWRDTDAREKFPELYEYIATLDAGTKRAIMVEALKGLVREDIVRRFSKAKIIGTRIIREKKKKIIRPKAITKENILEKYKELITDEINKRRLFDLETISEEMKRISAEYRPFTRGVDAEYDAYRDSAVELYADAVGMFLNNPQRVAEIAPHFNKAFQNYIGKKPTFKDVYAEMQIVMGGTESDRIQRLINRQLKGFEEVSKKRQEISQKKPEPKLSIYDTFINNLVSELYPAFKKLPKSARLEKSLDVTHKVRNTVENFAFSNQRVAKWLMEAYSENIDKLKEVGLDSGVLGVLFKAERELYGKSRVDKFNPFGTDNEYNFAIIRELGKMLTPEQLQVLYDVKRRFHEQFFEIIKEAHEVGIYSDAQMQKILEKEKDYYVTYAVGKYITEDNYISPELKKVTGYLGGDIENPMISTLFKGAAIVKAIERQKAVTALMDAFNEHLPGEFTKANRNKDGNFVSAKNKELLFYYKKGKWDAINVDPYIAKFFDPKRKNTDDYKFIHYTFGKFNKIFKPLVTSWNLGWALYNNIARDYPRTMRNMFALLMATEDVPNYKAFMIPYYMGKSMAKNWKNAARYTAGEIDSNVKELMKYGILNQGFFGSYDPYANQEIGYIFKKAGLLRYKESFREKMSEKYTVVKGVDKFLQAVEFAGSHFEALGKMSAFDIYSKHLGNKETAAFYTRNYASTPNYMDKGTATVVLNQVFPFSNVILQGLKADSEIAFGPRTRGAYWLQALTTNMIPGIMTGAATIGIFGDQIQNAYNELTEYDRSNFYNIPIGKTEDGYYKFIRIPLDEFSRFIYGMAYQVGTGFKSPEQLLRAGAGLSPSASPLIEITANWVAYMSKIRPMDSFRNQYIHDRKQWSSGRGATREMLKWTIRKSGGNWVVDIFEKDDYTKTARSVYTYIPVLRRAIIKGGAGITEENRNIEEEVKKRADTKSVIQDEIALKYGKEAMKNPDKDPMIYFKQALGEMNAWAIDNDVILNKRDINNLEAKYNAVFIKGDRGPDYMFYMSIMNATLNDAKKQMFVNYYLKHPDERFLEALNYMKNNGYVSQPLYEEIINATLNSDLK